MVWNAAILATEVSNCANLRGQNMYSPRLLPPVHQEAAGAPGLDGLLAVRGVHFTAAAAQDYQHSNSVTPPFQVG